MPALVAFLDANVLYPAELRSFLMYLALAGTYQARWSDHVHQEWISNLLANRPDLNRTQLERTRQLMDAHAPDSLVTGFEYRIEDLILPDPDDRHVLAAAVHSKASVIITNSEALVEHQLSAQAPDDFVMTLLTADPDAVWNAAETHRVSLKNPPKTIDEYLSTLAAQGLVNTASALRPILLHPALS
jgi:predicted nucleic acid-binding protein